MSRLESSLVKEEVVVGVKNNKNNRRTSLLECKAFLLFYEMRRDCERVRM